MHVPLAESVMENCAPGAAEVETVASTVVPNVITC